MAQSITLSSAGTATLITNPVAKSTTCGLTVSSSATGAVATTIQITLDDPSATPAPTLTWMTISSGILLSSATFDAGGVIYTVLSPVGGVRLNSTANTATATLKVLQSVTA